MDTKVFNWSTEFDTAKQTMTHCFKNFKVVVNFKLLLVFVLKDIDIVKTVNLSDMPFSLTDYETLLTDVMEADEKINTLKV